MAVVLCGLIVASTPIDAHETWIVAAPPRGEAAMVVAITNGTHFPEPESGLSRASLAKSGMTVRGETLPLVPVAELPRTLVARAPAVSGLATLWLALDAQPITLDDAQVAAYFEEIDADDEVRERWRAMRDRGWHERFAKFAKSLVRVGASDAQDDSWMRPVGGDLEIVPERDPTMLGSGEALPVRLLFHGKPLAGQKIAVTNGGEKQWRRTDAEGRATFVLTGSGPWLVHGTVLRADGDDWASWFTTLTFR